MLALFRPSELHPMPVHTQRDAPDAQRPQPASDTTTGPDKKALRGMSFAEGERALTPASDKGSALVVGSAQTTEEAHDNAFTPQLKQLLDQSPRKSLDEALQLMASSGKPIHKDTTQYATSAQIGDSAGRATAGGSKHALLVANYKYKAPSLPFLETPLAEAAGLASTLGGRGYASEVKENLTANQMRTAFATAALGSKAKAGDHVVLHYGGHGTQSGLCGVNLDGQDAMLAEARENAQLAPTPQTDQTDPAEQAAKRRNDDIKPVPAGLAPKASRVAGLDKTDLLPHSALQSIAQGAVGKGVHLTTIIDACHAGSATDMIHDEQDFPVGGEGATASGPSAATSPVPAAVEQIRSAKLGLSRMLANWQAERLGVSRGTFWDDKQKDDVLFELDLRYASMTARLWKEFLQPRVDAALLSVQSFANGPFAAPPPFEGSMTRGLLANDKAQPLLEWLDQTREAVRALKPPPAP